MREELALRVNDDDLYALKIALIVRKPLMDRPGHSDRLIV
jgi:hypothetical protein